VAAAPRFDTVGLVRRATPRAGARRDVLLDPYAAVAADGASGVTPPAAVPRLGCPRGSCCPQEAEGLMDAPASRRWCAPPARWRAGWTPAEPVAIAPTRRTGRVVLGVYLALPKRAGRGDPPSLD